MPERGEVDDEGVGGVADVAGALSASVPVAVLVAPVEDRVLVVAVLEGPVVEDLECEAFELDDFVLEDLVEEGLVLGPLVPVAFSVVEPLAELLLEGFAVEVPDEEAFAVLRFAVVPPPAEAPLAAPVRWSLVPVLPALLVPALLVAALFLAAVLVLPLRLAVVPPRAVVDRVAGAADSSGAASADDDAADSSALVRLVVLALPELRAVRRAFAARAISPARSWESRRSRSGRSPESASSALEAEG